MTYYVMSRGRTGATLWVAVDPTSDPPRHEWATDFQLANPFPLLAGARRAAAAVASAGSRPILVKLLR